MREPKCEELAPAYRRGFINIRNRWLKWKEQTLGECPTDGLAEQRVFDLLREIRRYVREAEAILVREWGYDASTHTFPTGPTKPPDLKLRVLLATYTVRSAAPDALWYRYRKTVLAGGSPFEGLTAFCDGFILVNTKGFTIALTQQLPVSAETAHALAAGWAASEIKLFPQLSAAMKEFSLTGKSADGLLRALSEEASVWINQVRAYMDAHQNYGRDAATDLVTPLEEFPEAILKGLADGGPKPKVFVMDERFGDELVDTRPGPEIELLRTEERTRVQQAVEQLPGRQRQVAFLVQEGHSLRTISQMTGMPLGTVNTHWRRAQAVLRSRLTDTG